MKCVIVVVLLFAFASAQRGGKIRNQYKPKCNTLCPAVYDPVCGTNGVTYSNQCEYEKAVCGIPSCSKVKIAYRDECKRTRTKRELPPSPEPPIKRCIRFCLKIYMPVCGSNGVTYGNKCTFENAKCRAGAAGKDWVIKHQGACKKPKCPTFCPYNYNPVCGSNGKTYANKCLFNVAKCKAGADWTIAHEGRCCNRACTFMYDPVCASNGETYSNKCVFRVEKCRAGTSGRTWRILYKGECKTPPVLPED